MKMKALPEFNETAIDIITNCSGNLLQSSCGKYQLEGNFATGVNTSERLMTYKLTFILVLI
jgi:hypothetical protein